MPIPVLLGAGVIAGIVSKLFSYIFDLVFKVVSKRFVFFVASVGTVLVLYATMWTVINGAISFLDNQIGPEYLAAVRVVIPTTIDEMAGAAVAIRMASSVFVFNAKLVLQKALI